jgi:hypothetical protein
LELTSSGSKNRCSFDNFLQVNYFACMSHFHVIPGPRARQSALKHKCLLLCSGSHWRSGPLEPGGKRSGLTPEFKLEFGRQRYELERHPLGRGSIPKFRILCHILWSGIASFSVGGLVEQPLDLCVPESEGIGANDAHDERPRFRQTCSSLTL